MVADELLPWIESRYSVETSRDRRLILGSSMMATRALDTALRYPDAFGSVAVQSPLINPAIEREMARAIADLEDPPRFYIGWCEVEEDSQADFTTVAEPSRRVAEALRAIGADVVTVEQPGGHGWQTWTLETESILARFLPSR